MSRFARRAAPPKYIVSEEVATDQVCQILDYYDFTDAQRTEAEGALVKLTDYVRRGFIDVAAGADGKINITVHLSDGKTHLNVAELGARHRLATDRVKDGGNYSRVYALIGSLTNLPQAGIEALPSQDLIVLEALGVVFLVA
jgi:hypothetical protein